MNNEFYCSDYNNCRKLRYDAIANISGNEKYPKIKGKIMFYRHSKGVVVRAEITGLPETENLCEQKIFAFHIHSGSKCNSYNTDSFAESMGHYNPNNCNHPSHSGDMPPLFGVKGKAFMIFLTDRFTIPEILGKTVIIHSSVDDFTSQPSGNSGEKIACGVVKKI